MHTLHLTYADRHSDLPSIRRESEWVQHRPCNPARSGRAFSEQPEHTPCLTESNFYAIFQCWNDDLLVAPPVGADDLHASVTIEVHHRAEQRSLDTYGFAIPIGHSEVFNMHLFHMAVILE